MDLFPLSRSLPRLLEGRDTTTLAEALGVAESTRLPEALQALEVLVRSSGYRAILVPFERGSDEPPDLEALFARVEELESTVVDLGNALDQAEETS